MTDCRLIPLPDGRWLLLSAETCADAPDFGAEAMGARGVSSAVDAELGAAMKLPSGWLEAAGRDWRLPCIPAGRRRRCQRSAVQATLSRDQQRPGSNGSS